MESKAQFFFVAHITSDGFQGWTKFNAWDSSLGFLGYSRIAKIVCFCDQDGRPSEELCFDIEVLRIFQVEILDRSSPIFNPSARKMYWYFDSAVLTKFTANTENNGRWTMNEDVFPTEKEDPVTASDPAIDVPRLMAIYLEIFRPKWSRSFHQTYLFRPMRQ